jgi:hypothetical protein
VLQSQKPVLVDWYAPWCQGCSKSYPGKHVLSITNSVGRYASTSISPYPYTCFSNATAEVCTILRNSNVFKKGFKLVKVSRT